MLFNIIHNTEIENGWINTTLKPDESAHSNYALRQRLPETRN